jgi:hypothetical protein
LLAEAKMATYESYADIALKDLCANCPLRGTTDEVYLARLDAELCSNEPDIARRLLTSEAKQLQYLLCQVCTELNLVAKAQLQDMNLVPAVAPTSNVVRI